MLLYSENLLFQKDLCAVYLTENLFLVWPMYSWSQHCALGSVNAKVGTIQILKKMYAYIIFVGDCINCLDHRAMLTMIPTQSTFVARG